MARRDRVEDGKNITVFLPQEVIERLDRIAEKADEPRNKLLRNFIAVWAETIEVCDKLGLWSMAVILKDFRDNCAMWVESVENSYEPEDIGQFDEWENRPWAKAKS